MQVAIVGGVHDSSQTSGLISSFQWSVNVNHGTFLLVLQWQCIQCISLTFLHTDYQCMYHNSVQYPWVKFYRESLEQRWRWVLRMEDQRIKVFGNFHPLDARFHYPVRRDTAIEQTFLPHHGKGSGIASLKRAQMVILVTFVPKRMTWIDPFTRLWFNCITVNNIFLRHIHHYTCTKQAGTL